MTTKGIAGYNRAIIPVVRDASAETERAAQERQRHIAKYVQREGADAKRDGACKGVAGVAATVTGALFMKVAAGTVLVPPVAIVAGIVGAGLMAYGGTKAINGDAVETSGKNLAALADSERRTEVTTSWLGSKELPEDAKKAKVAQKLFGNEMIKRIFIEQPSGKNSGEIKVYSAAIDSSKFDGVTRKVDNPDEKVGIDYDISSVPSEYKDLLEKYTKDGILPKELSAEQQVQFLKIAKALSTKDKYVADKTGQQEDLDFFDINDDKLLNQDDLIAYRKFVNMETNPALKKYFSGLMSVYNDWRKTNPTGELKDLQKFSIRNEAKFLDLLKTHNVNHTDIDKIIRDFNLNDDAELDSTDIAILRAITKPDEKFDIDKDKNKANDLPLLESYLKGNMLRLKNAHQTAKKLEKITGGEDKVEKLKANLDIE